MKLGVNVDHIATIREARKTIEPDPVSTALLAEKGGCDSVVVHLREDRRHINDRDVAELKKKVTTRLNLEMSVASEIVAIARKIRPHQATLVPERRQELTTEGGLNVAKLSKRIRDAVQALQQRGIIVNLFIDPEERQVEASKNVGADAVELHTGIYVDANNKERGRELRKIRQCTKLGIRLGLTVNAGHGLTYTNVASLAAIEGIEELNIGHSIVSYSVFVGMEEAVRRMKALLS
jgi:pyridoxine 5-phosphate synthase